MPVRRSISLAGVLSLAAALISLSAGTALAGTASAGTSTSSALAASHFSLGLNENMIYGTDGLSPVEKIEITRVLGGNVIRTSLDWRMVEPQQGQWDENALARVKSLYDWALQRQMRPIFDLISAPSWARDACPNGATECVVPPRRDMDGAWANYAAEMARRFPQAMFNVWNEPNLKSYWQTATGPDPARFAKLDAAAYDAIKNVDPAIPVLMGGLAGPLDTVSGNHIAIGTFLQKAYKARPSIKGKMDAISFHIYPHTTNLGPGSQFDKEFSAVRQVRSSFSDSTPLFITELGISTGSPDSVTLDQQSDTLWRAYQQIQAMSDVRGLVFHRLAEPRLTSTSPWELGMGFVRYGERPPVPNPVYCRFVAASAHSYPLCPDPQPLDTKITSAPPSTVASSSVGFEFTSPNYSVVYECSMDGGAYSFCWPGVSYSNLAPGGHVFSVRAVDATGGVAGARDPTPAEAEFTVAQP